MRMAIIYPYSWTGQFGDKAHVAVAKTEWMSALRNLTASEIERGFSACKASGDKFPPSIGMFVKTCKPTAKELGVVSADEAYRQFCDCMLGYEKKPLPNLLLQLTAKKIDMWSWKRATKKEATWIFKNAYAEATAEFLESQQDAKKALTSQKPENEFKAVLGRDGGSPATYALPTG